MATTSLRYDPAAHYEVSTRDVEYRSLDGESYMALLHVPQGPGPFPAILNVHGGAWTNGDRFANPQFAEGLAESGVVVASIEFRCGGEHPYPSSLIDINYGIRWLKAHAAELKADAATVGGIGVSSGGHLIVLAAMRPHDQRYASATLSEAPEADATLAYAITCWGVLDPYARYLKAKDNGNQELIGNHDRYWLTAEAMQEGNPVRILQRGESVLLPPCLEVYPAKDQWMSPEAAQSFVSLYQAGGGRCELASYPDMPHGIAGWNDTSIKAAVERMKAFIASCISVPAATR